MEFKDVLNNYIKIANCSAKDLAEKSGVSAATISRLRSGSRIPNGDDELLENLANGIFNIIREKNITEISQDEIFTALNNCCTTYDLDKMRNNLNMLISVFSINISKLSRALNYDPSYLSRIRNGQRRPAKPREFAEKFTRFIVQRYDTVNDLAVIEKMISCKYEDINNEGKYYNKLIDWLFNSASDSKNSMADFLTKLNDFDLNNYIKVIHFDELKVPSIPFQLPTSKSYFGLKEMMNSDIDFLKATVLSKSNESVILYSDMALEQMAKDPEFPKKWMFGMAMMLKKGLHLNQIHNLDRSYEDMMLGLEGWIPMYMTGQVSPFYLSASQNNVFCHLLKVSGTVALTGEAITGFQSDGKYYLTKNKEEVAYYRKRAEQLLAKAQPLMEIYRKDSENTYNAFIDSDTVVPGTRRTILSSLPLYTLDDDLLNRILEENHISDENSKRIYAFVFKQRELIEKILAHSSITDELPDITKEEFSQHPMSLSLSGLFFETDVLYSYEAYLEHVNLTKKFERSHANYNMKAVGSYAFRNIQIVMHEGKWVMVSKNNAPAIHFVIRHPKIRSAMENFIVPVMEE